MGSHIKAFLWSFGIHTLIFIAIIGISHFIPHNKYIVIDFSVVTSRKSGVKSQGSEVEKVKSHKPEAKSQKAEIKDTVQKTVSQIIPDATPLSPSISESEAQIPVIPSSPIVEGESKAEEVNNEIYDNSISSNTKTEVGNMSVSDVAEPSEKARAKYLKEHFTYIRDRITDNLSYPIMARKRGWSGKVTVSFIVYENGDVKDIKIIESSGFGILDKNVVETIKRILPFPKPPVKAALIIPVVYKLN